MKQKANIDRKKKRSFQKVLFVGLGGLGCVAAVVVGSLIFMAIEKTQPEFVSPLASVSFARSNSADNKLATLKKQLDKEGIGYAKIEKAEDESYIVELKQGGTVTFSSQKDISAQIASLQLILSHLTMEGKLFSRLDLRFEKPVIVLK
jgi:D-arabinose 1-dehydrogenase-like Zn-dependent alcohol dehydrogenase